MEMEIGPSKRGLKVGSTYILLDARQIVFCPCVLPEWAGRLKRIVCSLLWVLPIPSF
jgi:hypothetical protein